MVSRLSFPEKDHYTVIGALKELEINYGIKKNLLLLGDGPELDKLKSYCCSIGLENRVVFLGNRDDVQNYYAAATILVHASASGEGLPTVLLEAMNLDLPVVCTDSKVGPREILGNDEYGLLCNVGDSKDMAKKIYLLLSDNSLYKHYQTIGKKRMADFHPDKIILDLEKMLSKLE